MTSDSNEANKKWYRAFRLVQKDFYEFIKAEHPVIMNWNGTQTDAVGVYKRAQGGEVIASNIQSVAAEIK